MQWGTLKLVHLPAPNTFTNRWKAWTAGIRWCLKVKKRWILRCKAVVVPMNDCIIPTVYIIWLRTIEIEWNSNLMNSPKKWTLHVTDVANKIKTLIQPLSILFRYCRKSRLLSIKNFRLITPTFEPLPSFSNDSRIGQPNRLSPRLWGGETYRWRQRFVYTFINIEVILWSNATACAQCAWLQCVKITYTTDTSSKPWYLCVIMHAHSLCSLGKHSDSCIMAYLSSLYCNLLLVTWKMFSSTLFRNYIYSITTVYGSH